MSKIRVSNMVLLQCDDIDKLDIEIHQYMDEGYDIWSEKYGEVILIQDDSDREGLGI